MWLPGDRRGTPASGRYDGVPVPSERHEEQRRQQREQQRQQREQQSQQLRLSRFPAEAGGAQFRASPTIERRDERGGVHPRSWKLPDVGGPIERPGDRGPQQAGVGPEQRRCRYEGARHKIERRRCVARFGHRVAAVQRPGLDIRGGAVERAKLRQGEGRGARLVVRPAAGRCQP